MVPSAPAESGDTCKYQIVAWMSRTMLVAVLPHRIDALEFGKCELDLEIDFSSRQLSGAGKLAWGRIPKKTWLQ